MGISTYQSYCGAQIFDAVGLAQDFIDEFFTGTTTRIEGVGLEEIARETVRRHRLAFQRRAGLHGRARRRRRLRLSHQRRSAQLDAAHRVAAAARGARKCARQVSRFREAPERAGREASQSARPVPRSNGAEEDGRKPIPLDEVEPANEIVKRFSTGAMSFGSISREAHTTLAIAMNRIGGKIEHRRGRRGGRALQAAAEWRSKRQRIKQVASGRFGVTTEYLVNADMIQIKMAQGAKPGEGGQLPGDKVDAVIAKVRHSTPGVGLISPPPHHDIYSIEDLAQLIFDLEERQSARRRVGEARLGSRRRHGRRRRLQGPRRSCDDLRLSTAAPARRR